MLSDGLETKDPATSDFHPPTWLPKVSASADLGYFDFFPPRLGQSEEILSESNVKKGFSLGSKIYAENSSAQSILDMKDVKISRLENLMNEVFTRRADTIPSIPISTFRMPSRVTLNDAKREAWFADLANPNVPLYKLGKSVPHGAKGHDLLDLLHSNNVTIPRAVWFLRVFGANETAGLRNKSCYNPIQYSFDWTNVVTSYMKKQLTEVALPSAPRPGLNIKQTFKGVLSDSDARDRWISRFSYCLKLLRSFYNEGMVDNQTFLVWVIQQQGSCNLAQAAFITRLAEEYLEGFVCSRALSRPFIDACLLKLSEIRSSAPGFLPDTERLLQVILQRLCLAAPDAFISPRMWRTYSSLLQDILSMSDLTGESSIESVILHESVSDIRRRNEAMLYNILPVKQVSRLEYTVADVKVLNAISTSTDLCSLFFLPNTGVSSHTSFSEKLDLLLSWCVTHFQFGNHRIYVAVSLVHHWRNKEYEIEDSSEASASSDNIRSIALLFGCLIDRGLFSYENYIQRLVACGELGLLFSEEPSKSRHTTFLRWIPLSKPSSALAHQRKGALYGTRARAIPEDTNQYFMRRELQAALPELFSGNVSNGSAFCSSAPLGNSCAEGPTGVISSKSMIEICPTVLTSPCFEQVKTLRQWFVPILQRRISSSNLATNQKSILGIYSFAVMVMECVRDFQAILDLTCLLLVNSSRVEVLYTVICTLQRFSTIWACMGHLNNIVTSLDAACLFLKAKGVQFRPLLSLLLELDNNCHLSVASRDRVKADVIAFTMALQPLVSAVDIVPNDFPEITSLMNDPDVDAPSVLANSLWIKYRKTPDWASKVWENVIGHLSRLNFTIPNASKRRASVLRYGVFLRNVDRRLPSGLDGEVARWLLLPGRLASVDCKTWDDLIILLLHLSLHGALTTCTLINGFIFPTWRHFAELSREAYQLDLEHLRSANQLCRLLLVSNEINTDGIPPVNLVELQYLQTWRENAFHLSQFPMLANAIPLLIMVENSEKIPQDLRTDSSSLRLALSSNSYFRREAYRNPEALLDAFEQSVLSAKCYTEHLNKPSISSLHILLFNRDIDITEWPSASFFLSPWNVSPTIIEFRFIMKQISFQSSSGTCCKFEDGILVRLFEILLQHVIAPEPFYFTNVLQGIDGTIVAKFLSKGFEKITQLFKSFLCSESLRKTSNILRVLIHAAGVLRSGSGPMPCLDPSIQDEFLESLAKNLELLELTLRSQCKVSSQTIDDEKIVLFLRLLHLELGFHSFGSPRGREFVDKISSSLYKLAVTYGTSSLLCPVIYPIIIDTIYYICDEVPLDPRATAYNPFHNYPNHSILDIPPGMPASYRRQLSSLLPQRPVKTRVFNLVISTHDSIGKPIIGEPVLNRPWEWIENLGEQALDDRKELFPSEMERFRTRYLIKNAGSLSLDIFGTQVTGDAAFHRRTRGDFSIPHRNSQTLEDCLSRDGVFQRCWREGRTSAEVTRQVSVINDKNEVQRNFDHLNDLRSEYSKESPASSMSSVCIASSEWRSPRQGSCLQNSIPSISGSLGVVTGLATDESQSSNKRRTVAGPLLNEGEVEVNLDIDSTPRKQKRSKISTKVLNKARSRKK